jgi:START domain
VVFQKILSLAYDKSMNWDVVTKQENLIIDKVRPEGSPVVLIRAWAIMKDCSPFEINNQIYDTENRQKWDTVTNNIRVIDVLEDGSEIIHFVIKVNIFT